MQLQQTCNAQSCIDYITTPRRLTALYNL